MEPRLSVQQPLFSRLVAYGDMLVRDAVVLV
jgi:hypothetical protein